jgi:hypothetical protein
MQAPLGYFRGNVGNPAPSTSSYFSWSLKQVILL